MKLKPFGHGGFSIEYGDLEFHIGWIEALTRDEEENVTGKGPKAKRLEKVQDALALLHEAAGLST